jgi:hypothetical protein
MTAPPARSPRVLLAATLAAAATAAMLAARPTDTSPSAAATRTPPPPPPVGRSPLPPTPHSRTPLRGDADLHTGTRGSAGSDRTVARRFLDALLAYEIATTTPALARTLRATAAPALAADLLTSPPRPPAGAPPIAARLRALQALGTDGAASEFHALLRRGRTRSLLTVTVERRHGRPWVTRLR